MKVSVKRLIAVFIATAVLTVAAFSQTLPAGVQKVTSVEGITEYAFADGLHVLLFPDNSKPKITVNMVYLVQFELGSFRDSSLAGSGQTHTRSRVP